MVITGYECSASVPCGSAWQSVGERVVVYVIQRRMMYNSDAFIGHDIHCAPPAFHSLIHSLIFINNNP